MTGLADCTCILFKIHVCSCHGSVMFAVIMVRSNSTLRFAVVKKYIFNMFFGHVQRLMFVGVILWSIF